MPVDPRVRVLEFPHAYQTDTREALAHARQQVEERGLSDYFIVDVDSHREPNAHWDEISQYVENPVMRSHVQARLQSSLVGTGGQPQYVNAGFSPGHGFQDMFGRIPHQGRQSEAVDDDSVHRDIVLCRRAMDAMGIDLQVVFPTSLLALGMSPLASGEAQIAYAYDRWFTERFCTEEPRIKFLPYLPFRDPEMSLRIVSEFADKPGVVGYLVTSLRFDPVHDNKYMRLYAAIQETGHPIAFHAGPTWDADQWVRTMNRFISVHALTFVHCNMVHMTNWVINGLPERFPSLKTIWIESGLAWIPFLMQRLDHEYLKRTNEAPLLQRLPSEYMREMYFTSQPMERDNLALLESTFGAMNAETQLLYASDWPHWDFDLPSTIFDLPFLSEQAKRNILGGNARKLFNL
jgi:predicted TIM-barrel fold metal-dependent hydrolase